MSCPNVSRIDYLELWTMFSWLSCLSHFEMDWDDHCAMDVVEGRG